MESKPPGATTAPQSDNVAPAQASDKPLTSTPTAHHAQGGLATASASAATQLAGLQMRLQGALKQYPDFPEPGILFEDIMPLFAQPSLHNDLIDALQLLIADRLAPSQKPDVIVGLDARGFLFGPTLALRMDAGFVPVRKRGKLPGKVETATYQKEYGQDVLELQSDSIQPGQKVVVVDDIIATGGSATAAGQLVKAAGGTLLAYVFLMELDFLKGRDKLDAPVHTLLSSQAK